MTDDDVEKIIKRNMNLQINLAGIRADFEEAQQRTWVGLTQDQINSLCKMSGIDSAVIAAELLLKEGNA